MANYSNKHMTEEKIKEELKNFLIELSEEGFRNYSDEEYRANFLSECLILIENYTFIREFD